MNDSEKTLLLSAEKIAQLIEELADRILREFPSGQAEQLALIGIQSSGVPLARRLARTIREKSGSEPAVGMLDISMYRDDIGKRKNLSAIRETEIPFNIDGRVIILTDGVIQTGRSIRAALDAITGYGRPGKIRLAVLIDRGMREYPIAPDYTGLKIEVPEEFRVNSEWCEINEADAVYQVPRTDHTKQE